MNKYSLGESGIYSSRFRSAVAAVFSPRIRRERARRDGFRPDITDEEVRSRYYHRNLTVEDIVKYELYDDVNASELDYDHRELARKIGIHNLGNIDQDAYSKMEKRIVRAIETSELSPESSKEEIDMVIVGVIRKELESHYTSYEEHRILCELDITKTYLPEFIVEFPEDKKELEQAFIDQELTLEQVTENMDVFRGKRYAQRLSDRENKAFEHNGITEAQYQYACENFPELLEAGVYETIWATRTIDPTATLEENRAQLARYYKERGVTSKTAPVAINFISLEDMFQRVSPHMRTILDDNLPNILKEIDEKTFLDNIPIELLERGDIWQAFYAIERFGITPIIEFERENGSLFLKDNLPNLAYLNDAYLHYAGNRRSDSPAYLFVKASNAGNRPYTLEEFSEAMRRVIVYGPSNGNTKERLDYRNLQGPFRDANPDLFISSEAPEELQDKFYKTKITLTDIEQHPEYLEQIAHTRLDTFLERPRVFIEAEGEEREFYTALGEVATKEEIIDFIKNNTVTMKYLNKSKEYMEIREVGSIEEIRRAMESYVEQEILTRGIKYSQDAPEFFKEAHPEMFLPLDAPEELKLYFYDGYIARTLEYKNHSSTNYRLTFKVLGKHREWSELLKGKNIRRAMPGEYSRLLDLMEIEQLMKFSGRNGESIDKMVSQRKEDTLANWYKATGGKFIPHHTVMLNFPESEMDNFLTNGKKWSGLARIDRFNFNDEGKTATLKLAYSMGVFHGNDAGFKRVTDMLTLPPSYITDEDYEKIINKFKDNPERLAMLQEAYVLGEDGRYTYKAPRVEVPEGVSGKEAKKLAEGKVRDIRLALESADVSTVLTPTKAHQMFDSFDMRYDPKFVDFFIQHQEEIMSNPDYIKDIALIQRRFPEIIRDNAGRTLTLELAAEYIRSNNYDNVDIGNEGLAEQAKIAGYSQQDYDRLQAMYNEGEMRDYSSIPRVTGEKDGYTYEMLRCDDPLALAIGTLTDCCQEIGGAGQTSMEHSVLSEDGRVFVVRDTEGRIVAQSWFWRNQYTGCFDNIEIPNKIFTTYEREHPEEGRSGLTRAVLGVYKQATLDLMQEDERVYSELLENGTITREQYDALRLGKVTIGLGYNDIKDAIQTDSDMHRDTSPRHVIEGGRVPHPYTDAREQYVIMEREGLADSTYENLRVHEDAIPVYDGTNLPATTVTMMKKMDSASGKEDLSYVSVISDGVTKPSSELLTSIAREYYINPETTKVAATSRIALVYSAEDVGPVKMAGMLTAPLREGMTEAEQKQFMEHIDYQLKKALRQVTANGKRVLDVAGLPEADRAKAEELLAVIKKENEERGPR